MLRLIGSTWYVRLKPRVSTLYGEVAVEGLERARPSRFGRQDTPRVRRAPSGSSQSDDPRQNVLQLPVKLISTVKEAL